MKVWSLLRYCLRSGHAWSYGGSTLGGIWLRCVTCDSTEEFLPGLHEPKGGEAIWQAKLKQDRETWGWPA